MADIKLSCFVFFIYGLLCGTSPSLFVISATSFFQSILFFLLLSSLRFRFMSVSLLQFISQEQKKDYSIPREEGEEGHASPPTKKNSIQPTGGKKAIKHKNNCFLSGSFSFSCFSLRLFKLAREQHQERKREKSLKN